MSSMVSNLPNHLCIFVADPQTGKPVQRLPLYVEVAVPRVASTPPLHDRFRAPLGQAIQKIQPIPSPPNQELIKEIAWQALDQVLDETGREQLLSELGRVGELFHLAFKEAASDGVALSDLPRATLKERLLAAIRKVAIEMNLGVLPLLEDTTTLWANPLGILTTDHVGYVSFDLKRLRPDVQAILAKAIDERRKEPNPPTKVAIWIYPYGSTERYDAFAQARFATDAVVARLTMEWHTLPSAISNMGPRALQNPSLTDWRLSPSSFAASPKALVGEDGCEEMVPANLALNEFVLRQVVRITDPPDGLVPPPYKFAYVDEYKVSWFSLGHSLGEILYSLPLAPGETVKLAVIDWSWDSLTKRDEATKLTEDILHQTHRDRTITETVKAGLRELQRGSSLMGGTAHSSGATGSANWGVLGLGAAVGDTFSIGGQTATSEGSRELSAENVQRLNDSFSQASSAQRELNSTVVIQARQEEKETIQTRTFSNYNHSHTLTILYYEVLRHYKVTVEWIRRRQAVLVPTAPDWFKSAEAPRHALQNRPVLEQALLDKKYLEGFNAIERENHRIQVAVARGPKSLPLDANRQFRYFTFHIKTGNIAGDSNNNKRIDVLGTLEGEFGSRRLLGRDDKPEPDTKLNPPGSFIHPNLLNFFTTKPETSTVLWGSLFSITLTISTEGDGAKVSLRFIKVFGHDINGKIVELIHNNYELEPGGELHITQKAALILPINRPPLPAPPPEVPIEELEDKARARELIEHLGYHDSYYNRAVLLQADPVALSKSFQAEPWFSGQTLAEHVDPIPLEVFGHYVAYPLAKQPLQITDQARIVELAASLNSSDPARQQWAQEKLASLTEAERADVMKNIALASSRSERLITLPTRGVFAEGKLGHCNISEEIDNTRFWKWEEHPIPIEAPGINPVTPIQPQPQQVTATPTAFPQPLVNIVNPSPAPDPTGLTAALSLLGTPNIFRDMSGRQEVADLIKHLADKTIEIADAANRARGIQAKYGSAEGAVAPTGDNSGSAGSPAGTSRPSPSMPSEQVTPSQAQDAIKLSESETRKGNKTQQEHAEFSKNVQANIKGSQPTKSAAKGKPKKIQFNMSGWGDQHIVSRWRIDLDQRGTAVGFVIETNTNPTGKVEVGVTNEFDDNRYSASISGEVLAGYGINAMLNAQNLILEFPRDKYNASDYLYVKLKASVDKFHTKASSSNEATKNFAEHYGLSIEATYKKIIEITGGGEADWTWEKGEHKTAGKEIEMDVYYYTGGFTVESYA